MQGSQKVPRHVFHVTTLKKLGRYLANGQINAPVRAWKTVAHAERFSKQTGRKIIVRILTDGSFKQLPGHRGNAVYSESPYPVAKMEL